MSDEQGPMPPLSPESDERVRRVEIAISNLLRGGVILSLVLVVAGTVMSFLHHPGYVTSTTELERLTRPGAAFPHTLADVAAGLRAMHGQAVVMVGLLVLVATPVMRVAVSILAFLYQHDRIYAAITTVVLCLLLLSFALGKAG
jgi:uncharacterized membrane protein